MKEKRLLLFYFETRLSFSKHTHIHKTVLCLFWFRIEMFIPLSDRFAPETFFEPCSLFSISCSIFLHWQFCSPFLEILATTYVISLVLSVDVIVNIIDCLIADSALWRQPEKVAKSSFTPFTQTDDNFPLLPLGHKLCTLMTTSFHYPLLPHPSPHTHHPHFPPLSLADVSTVRSFRAANNETAYFKILMIDGQNALIGAR